MKKHKFKLGQVVFVKRYEAVAVVEHLAVTETGTLYWVSGICGFFEEKKLRPLNAKELGK